MPTEPKTFKTHTPNPRNPKHAICGLFRGYYELTDDEPTCGHCLKKWKKLNDEQISATRVIGRIITQMCEHDECTEAGVIGVGGSFSLPGEAPHPPKWFCITHYEAWMFNVGWTLKRAIAGFKEEPPI